MHGCRAVARRFVPEYSLQFYLSILTATQCRQCRIVCAVVVQHWARLEIDLQEPEKSKCFRTTMTNSVTIGEHYRTLLQNKIPNCLFAGDLCDVRA